MNEMNIKKCRARYDNARKIYDTLIAQKAETPGKVASLENQLLALRDARRGLLKRQADGEDVQIELIANSNAVSEIQISIDDQKTIAELFQDRIYDAADAVLTSHACLANAIRSEVKRRYEAAIQELHDTAWPLIIECLTLSKPVYGAGGLTVDSILEACEFTHIKASDFPEEFLLPSVRGIPTRPAVKPATPTADNSGLTIRNSTEVALNQAAVDSVVAVILEQENELRADLARRNSPSVWGAAIREGRVNPRDDTERAIFKVLARCFTDPPVSTVKPVVTTRPVSAAYAVPVDSKHEQRRWLTMYEMQNTDYSVADAIHGGRIDPPKKLQDFGKFKLSTWDYEAARDMAARLPVKPFAKTAGVQASSAPVLDWRTASLVVSSRAVSGN